MSPDKMIGVVKWSQGYEDRTQKVVVPINAPIFEKNDPTCNIQWERSTYSRFGETWESFSSMDHVLFALDRINKETISLKVRIATLFICPVCIEALATINSMSSMSHLVPLILSHEIRQS